MYLSSTLNSLCTLRAIMHLVWFTVCYWNIIAPTPFEIINMHHKLQFCDFKNMYFYYFTNYSIKLNLLNIYLKCWHKFEDFMQIDIIILNRNLRYISGFNLIWFSWNEPIQPQCTSLCLIQIEGSYIINLLLYFW